MDIKAYDERRDKAHEVLCVSTLKTTIEFHKQLGKIPTSDNVKREMGFTPEEAYFLDPYIHRAMEILLADIIEGQSTSTND